MHIQFFIVIFQWDNFEESCLKICFLGLCLVLFAILLGLLFMYCICVARGLRVDVYCCVHITSRSISRK